MPIAAGNSGVYSNVIISEETSLTSSMFRDYCSQRIPTEQEIAELAKRIQQGDKLALDEIVTRNMRLVISVACRHQGKGLNLEDLIQEGAKGLMRAAQKYDASRGNRFSTVAVLWIRQAIGRAINDQGNMIRIPVHVHDKIKSITNFYYRNVQETGEYPDKKEILNHVKVTERYFDKSLVALRIQPVSMDKVIDEEGSELGDMVADESPGPEEQSENSILRGALEKLMGCLTENEQTVIKMRYGWDDGVGRTLAETTKYVMNPIRNKPVTRERIRQIESKALAKLRRNANGIGEWR